MKYIVYAPSGEITHIRMCSADDIDNQLSVGESYIESDSSVNDITHYVDTVTLDLVAYPLKPGKHHVFDFVTMVWVDPRPLQDHKDERWSVIKLARENHISSPLVTPYGTFDADPQSKTNITDAISLLQTLAAAEQYPDIDFTLADNTVVTLGLTELVNVGILIGQRVQTAHGVSRTLRDQIDAATTTAEVEAIVWSI